MLSDFPTPLALSQWHLPISLNLFGDEVARPDICDATTVLGQGKKISPLLHLCMDIVHLCL